MPTPKNNTPGLEDILAFGGLASAGTGAGLLWGLGWGLIVAGGLSFALGVVGVLTAIRHAARRAS